MPEKKKLTQISGSPSIFHAVKISAQNIAICTLLMGMVNASGTASAQCRLCADPANGIQSSSKPGKVQKPLRLEITANLDFSKLAMVNRAGGEVSVDPLSGQRRISGALTGLGGMSLSGQGRLQGEPGRFVRVNLPERIQLHAPNGSTAEVIKLDTDLPVHAQLDKSGKLNFSFGGKLRVTGNAGGRYRGRIAITAEYE